MPERLLRVGDVESEHGFTRKTLRYWEQLGLVTPRSIGSHRAYGKPELAQLARVRSLVDAGYSPKQLQAVFRLTALPNAPAHKTETELFRELLVDVAKGRRRKVYVPTPQAYNTAFKRLRRLARAMNVDVRVTKTGDEVTVRSAGTAPRGRETGAKGRASRKQGNG